MFDERECRSCGCKDSHACEGGCSWVETDLCSKCKQIFEETNEKVMNNEIGLNYSKMPKEYLAEALMSAVAKIDYYENVCGFSLEDPYVQDDERDWKDHYSDHKFKLVELIEERLF